jgi:hypothetical protein
MSALDWQLLIFQATAVRLTSGRLARVWHYNQSGTNNVADDLFIESARELQNIISRQLRFLTTRPHSYKTLIIAALGVRAGRLNNALFVLTTSSLREEANALLRILIVVMVNGAYLMVSGKKGVPHICGVSNSGIGQEPSCLRGAFTEDLNQLVATNALEAELMSGRTPKDSSWKSQSVQKRALAADAIFQHGIFGDLAATAYAGAHDYVHGNFPRLQIPSPLSRANCLH